MNDANSNLPPHVNATRGVRFVLKQLFKVLVGAILLILFHLPGFVWAGLLLSHAAVFNNRPNLPGDALGHLKRARRLLRKRRNALLLYAALDIRFSLERLAQLQILHSSIPAKARKWTDPVKRLKALYRIHPTAKIPHQVTFIVPRTGERFEEGKYTPLDLDRVSDIHGGLGDLLHPKSGIPFGVWDHEWYRETRAFLQEALEYLWPIVRESKPYFYYQDLPIFEMRPETDA